MVKMFGIPRNSISRLSDGCEGDRKIQNLANVKTKSVWIMTFVTRYILIEKFKAC